jgi:hypothetical protein
MSMYMCIYHVFVILNCLLQCSKRAPTPLYRPLQPQTSQRGRARRCNFLSPVAQLPNSADTRGEAFTGEQNPPPLPTLSKIVYYNI